MLQPFVLGSLLGLFSGVVPGPFTALIAATSLKGGFRAGFWIAVVPLVTETVVLACSALVLSQLPEDLLQWLGGIGGVFIFYLAYRTWRESRNPPDAEPLTGSARQIAHGALLAVISPTPWVFWLLIGAPLFLGAWHQGWGAGLVFLGSFLVCFVGVYLGVAALAAYGRKKVTPAWHGRLLRGAAGALVIAGGVLLWQSYVGNFHRMVQGGRTLESIVTDSVLSGN